MTTVCTCSAPDYYDQACPLHGRSDSEVVYPPRGYCIGFFSAGGTIVGPFATAAEARHALSQARICVVGDGFRPNWDGGATPKATEERP